MKKIVISAIMLLVTVAGFSQEKNFIDQNYISVSGYNKMKVVPDMIYISITIDERDTKGKVSVERLESDMIKALEGVGIDVKKQLTVNDLSSNFKNYILRKQDVMQSKSYTLLVGDATAAMNVFLALEKANISNATVTAVDNSRLSEYKLESKVEAVKAAKEKAAALARGLEQDIGKAIYILDNEMNYSGGVRLNTVMVKSAVAYEADYSGAGADLQFREIEIESNVTVYFELK